MSITLPNIGGGFTECLYASEWKQIHDKCPKCGLGVCGDHLTTFLNVQPDPKPETVEQKDQVRQ